MEEIFRKSDFILWPPLRRLRRRFWYYDPPSPIIMTPPSKFFVVFHLLEKVINVLYIPKKHAAGANLGKFSFISPLNGCILVKSNGKMDINFQLALSGFLFFQMRLWPPPRRLSPPSFRLWPPLLSSTPLT